MLQFEGRQPPPVLLAARSVDSWERDVQTRIWLKENLRQRKAVTSKMTWRSACNDAANGFHTRGVSSFEKCSKQGKIRFPDTDDGGRTHNLQLEGSLDV